MIVSHHGMNSLKRNKIDPRIILLWYGNDKDYLPPSDKYSEMVTLYDENGPLNVEGTGWSGTPCVSRSGLGGLVHNNGGNWLQLNKGLHWRQPEVLSQLDKSKPWTFEFWLRSDTGGFSDGDKCVSFMTKPGGNVTGDGVDGDGVLPNPAIGGYYGMARFWYRNSATVTTSGTPSSGGGVFSPAPKWAHFALTYDGSGTRSGLRLYINGNQSYYSSNKPYGEMYSTSNWPWAFKDLQAVSITTSESNTCNWRIAQICLMNYVRYTKNFTPQKKPYFLGLDEV